MIYQKFRDYSLLFKDIRDFLSRKTQIDPRIALGDYKYFHLILMACRSTHVQVSIHMHALTA